MDANQIVEAATPGLPNLEPSPRAVIARSSRDGPTYQRRSELHAGLNEAGAPALLRLVDAHLAEAPKPRLKPGDRETLKPLKRLDCATCVAACCHVAGHVDISLFDAQRLADALGVSIGTFLDEYTARYEDMRVIKLHGDRCRFLGPDNRCTVYAARPDTCRDYLCWRGDVVTNNVARVLGARVVEPRKRAQVFTSAELPAATPQPLSSADDPG
jgi:hypothetical protein